MQIRAIDRLFIRDRDPEYVQPGEVVDLDDQKAQLLIDRGHAEAVTTAPQQAQST